MDNMDSTFRMETVEGEPLSVHGNATLPPSGSRDSAAAERMPLEVVVELQLRAVSCPGVFLPNKQDVYLGVYFLNQYLETDCFPPLFPVVIHQTMRFEKVFEKAVDPGAVADILEGFLTRFELVQLVPPGWEKLAYYEENTREFLFPEPKLTPSHPGMCREVLMKTAIGFPGIAPKLEFSTRTAIRERVCLHWNRFLEDRAKPQKPLLTSPGPILPTSSKKTKSKGNHLDRASRGAQSRSPSPLPARRHFQDQPVHANNGHSASIARDMKPPFVVRHVDSAKPFGETFSELRSRKSRRKCKLSNFPFPMRRASLDSLAIDVKVIKEPDERIVLRNNSPTSPLGASQLGKAWPSYSNGGDADFHQEAPLVTSQHLRPSSPLLRERFHSGFESTWKKIHERICNILTSHRAEQPSPTQEDATSAVSFHLDRQGHSLKKYPLHGQSYLANERTLKEDHGELTMERTHP